MHNKLAGLGVAMAWLAGSSTCLLAGDSSGPKMIPSPVAVASAEAPSRQPELRTWTDHTGTLRAKATLIAIDGDTLTLRKPNGKLARATIERISAADQRYVAGVRSRLAHPEASGLLSQGLWSVMRAPGLNTLTSPFRSTAPVQDSPLQDSTRKSDVAGVDDPKQLPASLITIQVSRAFLMQYVDRTVDTDEPLVDSILGTSINGRARTRGATDLALQTNPHQAVADVLFAGTIDSNTLGYNGPMVLHNTARTRFQARARIVLDSSGLQVLPSATQARTSSVTTGIDTDLPRLRGRIATRVGWQRAAETRSQVNEIAARHAEARVGRQLTARVNESLVDIRKMLAISLSKWAGGEGGAVPVMQLSSTPKCIAIVVQRGDATPEEHQLRPPVIEGEPLIAAQMHQTVVRRVLNDPEFRQALTALVTQIRAPQPAGQKVAVSTPAAPNRADYELKWSADGNWLLLASPGNRRPPTREVVSTPTVTTHADSR